MISIKSNSINQLKNWRDFFLQVLMFIPLYIYCYYKYGTKSFFIIHIFILIQFLFTAYLAIRYYFKNKGEEFKIYEDKIVKTKGGLSVIYNANDIKKIVICKSANMDKGGIPITTFETFRIARIYLKDRSSFIMTNILEYDIEKPLSILRNVEFERRKGFSFFI